MTLSQGMDIVCDGNGQDHIYLWKNIMPTAITMEGQKMVSNGARPVIQARYSSDGSGVEIVVQLPGFFRGGILEIRDLRGRLVYWEVIKQMSGCGFVALDLGKDLVSGVVVLEVNWVEWGRRWLCRTCFLSYSFILSNYSYLSLIINWPNFTSLLNPFSN